MPKVIKKHGEYFPKEDLWLVFDMSNGHKETRQYVWYFRSKELALLWIKEHKKKKSHYDVSYPTKWSMIEGINN
jgi:hypothetical protein